VARILVVDDTPMMVKLVTLTLANAGHEVRGAEDGVQGVAVAKEWRPELIIMDVMMPEMDGWQVCEEIHSSSDVPILILSALGAPGSVARALDAGADDYLIKPVHASLLASRLRTLVRRRSLALVGADVAA